MPTNAIRGLIAIGLLAAAVGMSGCGGDSPSHERLDANALIRCGARGRPVNVAKLVKVFRANGITLDMNEAKCTQPKALAGGSDATNNGPDGLHPLAEIDRKEGSVLCRVDFRSFDKQVRVVKWDTDIETHLRVLNVGCALYPHDDASEASQVKRMGKALAALARATA